MNNITRTSKELVGALSLLRNAEGEPWVTLRESDAKNLIDEIERLRRSEALLLEIQKSMADCIGTKEGQTFEDRAEELIVTEVQHMHCSAHEPSALRDALDAIASPSRPEDYGWWTQVARRALGIATARETAQPPAVDDAQRSALVYVLRDLKAGIAEHATDVVWYSAIQTACERIEEIASALSAPIVARYCPFSHRPCEPIELDGETVEVATLTKEADSP